MSSNRGFLDQLPEELLDALPVMYRKITPMSVRGRRSRLVESKFYRAKKFDTYAFCRPISKILLLEESLRAQTDADATVENSVGKDNSRGIDKSRIFKLFACCIPVLGARRSTLCDLQRQTFHFIPNGLYEILTEHKDKTIEEIEATYDHEYDIEIEEYFEFLIEQELGFWCSDTGLFPALDLTWKTPEKITNAIVDVDAESDHDFVKIFRDLDDLGCKHLQLRFFDEIEIGKLDDILVEVSLSRLRSVDILLRYYSETTPENLGRLATRHGRIDSLIVHSAPKNDDLKLVNDIYALYRTRTIDSPQCCGEIHPAYFVTNLQCFSEAQANNTCLNGKIAVDARGEIKNCPSMRKSFGNVREVPLHSALARLEFRELWSINKDQISVCRDCEFRYICTDCRAYLSDSDDRFSKPSKCTYDPYTASWLE